MTTWVMQLPVREIIIGCWATFVLVWLASAAFVKRTAEPTSVSLQVITVVPIVLAILLLTIWQAAPVVGLRLWHATPASLSAALLATLAGLAVTLWARFTLAGNWSGMVTFKEGHELVMRGPYRFVRHPIYTGILLMLLGTAFAIGRLSAWLALAVKFAGFWYKLHQEEALLRNHFPDSYPPYEKRVKRLIPYLL